MPDKHDKKSEAQKKAEKTVKAYSSKESVKGDPSGSYTGRPKEKHGRPVQDADDL